MLNESLPGPEQHPRPEQPVAGAFPGAGHVPIPAGDQSGRRPAAPALRRDRDRRHDQLARPTPRSPAAGGAQTSGPRSDRPGPAAGGQRRLVLPGHVAGRSGSSASPAPARRCCARTVMGLLPGRGRRPVGVGAVRGPGDHGRHLAEALRSLWGARIAMVFQDPMTSLNPVDADRAGRSPSRFGCTSTWTGRRPRRRPSPCSPRSASRRPRSGTAATRASSRAACASG